MQKSDYGEQRAERAQCGDAASSERRLFAATRERRQQTGQYSTVDAGHQRDTQPDQPVIGAHRQVNAVVLVGDAWATAARPAWPYGFPVTARSLYRQHG